VGKKKAKTVVADSDVEVMNEEMSTEDAASIEDGKVVDYITGNQVKDSPKEKVRQRIARAIWHEYGFSPNDMQPDFKVNVGGRRKGVDIAIFQTGSEHTLDNMPVIAAEYHKFRQKPPVSGI
jgi:type I restriction enzyme M protein